MSARHVQAFLRSRGGNIAAVFGLALVPVAGLVGAAVDYSRASDGKVQLQMAIDGAVLAGIAEPAATRNTKATNVFRAIYSGPAGATPTFPARTDGVYEGTATVDVPVQFMKLFNKSTVRVSASASAAVQTTSTTTTTTTTTPAATGGVCILLLDGSATDALRVNSSVGATGPDCEVHVRSTAAQAANFDSGNPGFKFKKVCVAGGANVNGGLTVNGLQRQCTAATDPFAANRPTATAGTCTSMQPVSGTVELNPGTYCNGLNFNGTTTVKFKPGLYLLKNGSWNVGSSTWTCPTCTGTAGVTFYFADSTSFIQFNSGVKMTLSAPTAGTYAGYLFLEAPSLAKTAISFNAGPAWSLKGLMYLPSRNVTFNSGTEISSGNLTMVYNQLILNAGTKWTFTPNAEKPITPPDAAPTTTTTSTTTTTQSNYLKD